MKKTILGSAMLISGILGFMLTILASTNTAERSAVSRIWGAMNADEWIFALAFLALSLAGFILALSSFKEDK